MNGPPRPHASSTLRSGQRQRAIGRVPAIAIVLLAGLAVRLLIAYVIWPGQGLSNDLLLLTTWAQSLAEHGPSGFYGNTPFADYPPGYLWVLWIEGLAGNVIAGVLGKPAIDVIGVLHKLPAIGADLLIALLLYRAARQWRDERTGLWAAALYLFIPVAAYNSALWGQVDSVGALLLLSSVLLLISGWSEAAVAMSMLAAVTKPQYAIGLAVVGAVLLRRHLLQPGSGPIPPFGPILTRLNARTGGRLRTWMAVRQGPERLLICAAVAFVVFFAAILPFDLPSLTSNDLADIPLVGHVAGLLALVGTLAASHNVLTANAFNFWALVGPTPLSQALNNYYQWSYDSLAVVGPLSAATVGGLLLVLVSLITVVTLLLRDDRKTILIAFTVLAVAFFALPTRAHERYLFPAFATGALLAATAVRWRWWYVALGLLSVANLHAILTMPFEGYATPGLVDLFPGRLLRDEAFVTVIAIGHTVAFAVLVIAFVRLSLWPAIRDARATGWAGIWQERPASIGAARSVARMVVPRAGPSARGPDRGATTRAMVATAARTSHARPSVTRWLLGARRLVTRLGARLPEPDPRPASAQSAVAEPGGRLDRKDLAVFGLLVVVTFGMRAWRLELPRTEYFDEYWHASTATEFLQDWRYGIPHTVFEWTHPHLAKYAMAVSVAAFGDNTARGAGAIGVPVRGAALVPARAADGNPIGLVGDQLLVATGADVRVAPHGRLDAATVVPLQGASAVTADRGQSRAFVGTDAGGIFVLDAQSLEAPGTAGSGLRAVAQIGMPITQLWVAGTNRVIAQSPGDRLTLVDPSNGAVLATAHLGGMSGLLPVTTSGGTQFAIVAFPGGLAELEINSLRSVTSLSLPAPPIGLDLVDGSAQGHRERELLFQPTLYVATGAARIETVVLAPDGTLQPAGGFPTPGPVSDVRWDRTTNLVHVLGKTREGASTIYVVDPHSNAVFADAALPFSPAAWVLDVQPAAPSLDRQQALAFSATGEIQAVDVGNNAFAWRLPGVLAGALMAGFLFLLTRLLFRRRIVGLLVAVIVPLEGLLFAQSRIAMNDAYVGLFVVAAFALLAYLLQSNASGLRARIERAAGLPALGVLLGLALASKWVAIYAIAGVILLVLLRSRVGQWLAFAGMIGLTTVFGYLAVADNPSNLTFLLLMLALTSLFAVGMARRGVPLRSLRGESVDAHWVEPRWRKGIPFGWALLCLTILPIAVYVLSYVPWAVGTAGGPQLLPGWPPGHTGQTFLDLQAQMYRYHNELRAPHGASSPWWAWPLDLKPIWGYLEGFADGTQATILGTGNLVLLWLAIPAVTFGAWQAWRRRSFGLIFVVLAFLCLWLPWARIDRVAYNYHYYVALPFALVLLAYFLAELWEGASAWTWLLARVAAALVLLGPAIFWIVRTPLCGFAGVDIANPGAPVCAQPTSQFILPVTAWWIVAVLVSAVVWRLRRARWLVAGMVAASAATFLVLYPALAASRIPDGAAWVYQGLLPSWDSSFYFNNNQAPVTVIPFLTAGHLATFLVTVTLAAVVMRMASRWSAPSPDGPVGRLRNAMERRAPGSQTWAPAPDVSMSKDARPATAMGPLNPAPTTFKRTRRWLRIVVPGLTDRSASTIDRFGIPLALFVVSSLVYAWVNHGRPAYYDYFVPLADAFLHGRLGLLAEPPGFTELVPGVNHLLNVVYPPGPAIVLVPFVWLLGTGLEQSWASILLGAANVAIVSVILARMGIARRGRLLLSLTFAFGTIVWYSAQIGTSWHFAHVVAIFFTLLAIVACQRDSPTWLIGLLFGAAVLSRLPVFLAAPFFLAYFVDRSRREAVGDRTSFGSGGAERLVSRLHQVEVRPFLRLALPWILGGGVLAIGYLAYNWLRFGSIIETGDSLVRQTEYSMEHGLLSLFHFPRIFVSMFLSGPARVDDFPFFQPRIVGGLSILLTSPIFVWAARARPVDWFTLGAWVSVVLVLTPVLLHVDEGGSQFGFRYAQDAYPFVFLLAVRGLNGRIGRAALVAIGIGVLVNVWGMAAAYNAWWSLSIPDSQVPLTQVGSLPIVVAGLVLLAFALVIRQSGRWVVMPAAGDGGLLGIRLIGFNSGRASRPDHADAASRDADVAQAHELRGETRLDNRAVGGANTEFAVGTPVLRVPRSLPSGGRLALARALEVATAPTSRRVMLLGLIPAWLLFLSSDTVPLIFDAQQYYNLATTWANGNILPAEVLFRGYSTGLFLVPAVLLSRLTSIAPETAVLLEMSAVLAALGWIVLPRLQAIVLDRPATLADRAVSLVLLYLLWGGYSSAGLTDFPALVLFLVALLLLWKRGRIWLLPVAGLLGGLAFNLRPAYVVGMAGIVVLAALTGTHAFRSWLRRGGLVALGVVIALTPQAVLNTSQGLPAIPPTPATTAQFLAFQLQTGLYFQRYETAQDPAWPSPQIFACDPGGIALVVASGQPLPSTLTEYAQILASNPIAGAALITRRVANLLWLDNRSAYVTDVSGRGDAYGLLNVLLVGLFAALVVGRARQSPRLRTLPIMVVLACAPAIISIPDLRFFLPVSAVAIAFFVPTVSWLATATPRIRVAALASCVLLILATSAVALEARVLEIPGATGNANPSCFAPNVVR